MAKSTGTKKRNKLTVALLAPILIVYQIIGWSFYWLDKIAGRKKQTNHKKQSPARPNEVELTIIPPKEKEY